jgi:hypothetical protein
MIQTNDEIVLHEPVRARTSDAVLLMRFVVTGGSFLWLWAYCKWLLLERISDAYWLPLLGAAAMCMLGSLTAAICWLASGLRAWKTYLVTAVVGFAFVAGWWYLPLPDFYLKQSVARHQRDYDQAAQIIQRRELRPDKDGAITLPAKYRSLSEGGVVSTHPATYGTYVRFTVASAGMESVYYIYSPRGGAPERAFEYEFNYRVAVYRKGPWCLLTIVDC